MMELLLGQIPEALYFALFIIFAKRIKEKRILFTVLMVLEYLLLINIFKYDVKFHISFIAMIYLMLKVLYNEKAQITDIFIVLVSYLFLGITSALCFFICNKNALIASIVNRLLIFGFIFAMNNKLYKIQKIYKLFWNRNKDKKIMKSATFRSLNVVLFNLTFYVINIVMLYCKFLLQKG